jgi:hypothetical protein
MGKNFLFLRKAWVQEGRLIWQTIPTDRYFSGILHATSQQELKYPSKKLNVFNWVLIR